jgi:hypothetical protein
MNQQEFLDAYIECALWSTHDWSNEDGGAPLDDNYGPDDIAPECIASMQEDCAAFIADNLADLEATGATASQSGHDFWLTRNRHGAGFWDRGYGKVGERLTAAAHTCGSRDLYVGDDGRIYES